MSRARTVSLFVLGFFSVFSFPSLAQEDTGWRISPEKVNIQMGSDRPLQLLDDSAQELHGAVWTVNNPNLAEIREEEGLAVLHSKGVGTVVVSATLGQETRTREIKIWSALRPLPLGTTNWGLHPIGREVGDLPAVPTPDGPEIYSLEQTEKGDTYLRADRHDGIQVWTWKMPEQTHDVALVCGDWTGGALISADRGDGFTLYTVDKEGTLRWQHTFEGARKSHAYNLEHLVHIVSQSQGGTVTTITGLDEISGNVQFTLTVPASHQNDKNLRAEGAGFVCATGGSSKAVTTDISRIIVNMDSLAYVAFRQSEWSLDAGNCKIGSVVDRQAVTLTRDDKIMLWQIHPDGTYVSFTVEANKLKQSYGAPVNITYPTPSLLTDNMNGTLIPMRTSHVLSAENLGDQPDEYIYRVNPDGELVYRLPLPKYPGVLHDDVVIGNDELGFATRGGVLIAFNVREGKELWRWDSNTDDISVSAALADGSCLVQTPTEAVDVWSPTKVKVYMSGKAMLSWKGVYRKHN